MFTVLGKTVPPSPSDVVIRWHKSYDRLYMKGNEATNYMFDQMLDNEAPGPSVPCESIDNFRSDVRIGDGDKPLSFFFSALPGKAPVLQPGIKWANKAYVGPRMSQQQHGAQMPSLGGALRQTVSLSQHVVDQGTMVAHGAAKDDGDDSSVDYGVPPYDFDDGDNNSTCSSVDVSDNRAATSSASAPMEDDSTEDESRLAAIREALKSGKDAFSLVKPRLEQITGLVGKDEHLILEIQDILDVTMAKVMLEKSKASGQAVTGVASLPETDTAKRSKRIPTGHATPKRKHKSKK
jgi:hypothetical protein